MARSPERAIQTSIFQHHRIRGRGLLWAVPNGGKRDLIEAVNLKRSGVMAGASDIMGLWDGHFYALELKAEGGKPTEKQMEFIAAVNEAGGYATWACGLTRALNVLEMWGLLRPERNVAVPAWELSRTGA